MIRVGAPHLDHVGVYVFWAHDRTYCGASYRGYQCRIDVDRLEAVNPEFRAATEQHAIDIVTKERHDRAC